MAARVKRDDRVFVLRGKDAGNQGKVLRVLPSEGKVVVEGINLVKRHTRGNPAAGRQGGIVSKEMPMDMSKVMPVCPSCGKPTRINVKQLDDGTKARVCKRCQGMMN
ncbi:MAG: 50S ribosomal protein L24 [SAR202 cluster bacterium]|nr:50S ribosomal protein L24 [SAR202 cluster bacterium]